MNASGKTSWRGGLTLLLGTAFVLGFVSGGALWTGLGFDAETALDLSPGGHPPASRVVLAPKVTAPLPQPKPARPGSRERLASGGDGSGHIGLHEAERGYHRTSRRVTAEINGSFYRAARRAALAPAVVDELVKLLSWDVDFQRDIQPGDRFEVLLEQLLAPNDERVRREGLSYVALDLRGRRIEAYRFTDATGRASWYDRDGRALRKWLLRTPIDGARLSSLFGPRRHPVLGFTRMHKGIDFAAAPGTPVYAAGDGAIELAERNRGFGKYVRIRHQGEYRTAYAHLSRFAKGIKPGQRVEQGQVIGYVGSTGLSTGPHLHYEVLHGGQQVNPLGLQEAWAQRLEGVELRRFWQVRAEIDALRDGYSGERLLAQDIGPAPTGRPE